MSYGLGLPVSNRLELVEFDLGYSHIGGGLAIAESYGFRKDDQFIGTVIPLHLTIPLYQKIRFGKTEAYFEQEMLLKVRGSPWAQLWETSSNIGYLSGASWISKAPYLGLELTGRWVPVKIAGVYVTLGALFVRNAPDHLYLNIGVSTGTAGPVSEHKIGPRLKIVGVVYDDAETGNSNGVIEPGEKGRLLVLLVNSGLQDSRPITLQGILRDIKLAQCLSISSVSIPSLGANHSTEVALPVTAASQLPALPLRVRVWGKDEGGNLVAPAYLEIPTTNL